MNEAIFYRRVIDPFLGNIHTIASMMVKEGSSVLDVACGNGTLSLKMAVRGHRVTAVDLSPVMISYARQRIENRKNLNVQFLEMDATDLTGLRAEQFHTAIISMAVHQFEPEVALQVLTQMKKVAMEIIIVDYLYPQGKGISRAGVWLAERMAGGEHYANFLRYMQSGGIPGVAEKAGLLISRSYARKNGAFMVALCNIKN